MTASALLVLEDGTAVQGRALGASGQTQMGTAHGEVVFCLVVARRAEARGMVWGAAA